MDIRYSEEFSKGMPDAGGVPAVNSPGAFSEKENESRQFRLPTGETYPVHKFADCCRERVYGSL